MRPVGFQSKQLYGAASAAGNGASDIEDVLQALNLDEAVDLGSGACAVGQSVRKLDLDFDSSIDRRRASTGHGACDTAAPCFDLCGLTNLDVSGLFGRDLEDRSQRPGFSTSLAKQLA